MWPTIAMRSRGHGNIGRMERWISVLVALGLGMTLAVTSSFGYGPIAFASGLLVFVFAFGWPRLTDSPQPWTTSFTLGGFGFIGMLTTWLAIAPPYLEWLPILAGLGLLWAFVQNLVRGIEASHAVANVSAEVAGIVITLSACTWIATVRLPGNHSPIYMALAGIFLAQCATALPWPARYTSPLAVVAGVFGATIAHIFHPRPSVSLLVAVIFGMVLGGIVAATDRILGLIARARFQATSLKESRGVTKARSWGVHLAIGAAPIALSGVAVYAVHRLPAWAVVWFG